MRIPQLVLIAFMAAGTGLSQMPAAPDVQINTADPLSGLDHRTGCPANQPPPSVTRSVPQKISCNPQQRTCSTLTDVYEINRSYLDNPVNADLHYKGQFFVVTGRIEGISNDAHEKGTIGRVEFIPSTTLPNPPNPLSWSCTFDVSETRDIAQLHKGDPVFLRGEYWSYLNFRHCSVVPESSVEIPSPPPEQAITNSDPVVLNKVEPEYTDAARHLKISGSVLIGLVVDENGNTCDLRVLRPLGYGLDEKALDAVAKWHFRPAIKNGRVVKFSGQILVNFRML